MPNLTRLSLFCAACAALMLAGCGGGSSNSGNTQSAAPAATTEAQREQMALPTTTAAPVPGDLKCKDEIVWVNLHTKAYHEPGDPYYGRSRTGKYMCKAAAEEAGYHLAGAMHSHKGSRASNMGGSMNGSGATATASPDNGQ